MDTGFKWGETLDAQDNEFAQRRDAVANRITWGLAYAIITDLEVRKVTRKRDAPGDVDDRLTDEVQDYAEEYHFAERLPEAVAYERGYGMSVCPILREEDVVWLEPKSERNINAYNFFSRGALRRVEIHRIHSYTSSYLWVDEPNFVHFRTRPREDLAWHEGVSLLEAVWDPIETLRKVVWGAGQRMYRTGFMHMKIANAKDDVLESYRQKFGNLTARTQAYTDQNSDIVFPSLGGAALDPVAHEQLMLDMVCIQTGIPMEVLRGESEATLASGAIAHHGYFSYLKSQQKPLLPLITELLAKLGFTLPDDRALAFHLEFELDPKDASLVEMNKISTIERRIPWTKLDELRTMDPMQLSAIEGGDKRLAELQPQFPNGPPSQGPFEGKQQPRTAGRDAPDLKQQMVAAIDAYRAEGLSVTDAVRKFQETYGFQLSKRSYYRWKNHG